MAENEVQGEWALPDGWEWTTLEEVCLKPQYGWTAKAVEAGELHLLRTTDITPGKIDWESVPFCREEPADVEKYLLYDGDIVISRAGSVGYSYLVKRPKRAVFASYLIRFKPLVDEQYVAYFLQSPIYWESVYEERLGIAIPNINATKLKGFAVPLAPLPEQRRIVAEIETQFTRLDAGVVALERAQANLKRYRAAVLKAACGGWLVPTEAELARILTERRTKWEAGNPGKKYKEPAPPDVEGLPDLPEGWVWTALEIVADAIDPHPSHRTPPIVEDGVPYVGRRDIDRKGRINRESARKVSPQILEEHKARYQLKDGDFIFGKIGTLGKPAVLTKPFDYALSANVILIQL